MVFCVLMEVMSIECMVKEMKYDDDYVFKCLVFKYIIFFFWYLLNVWLMYVEFLMVFVGEGLIFGYCIIW